MCEYIHVLYAHVPVCMQRLKYFDLILLNLRFRLKKTHAHRPTPYKSALVNRGVLTC